MRSTLRKTPGLFLVGLLLGPALVSGCTTTAGGLDTVSTFDLALPDTVSVIPSLSDGTAVAALETTPDETVASAATASVMTASYAGSTPSAGSLAAAAPIAVSAPAAEPVSLTATEDADDTRDEVERLIAEYATLYEVPVELVRRVVKRESNFFPGAHNNGHWGLMQIKHATARGMGYQGTARGLLDAETNLKYAVKYLRGAYLVADGNHDLAVRFYARGYYYDAKRKGLLDETGLGTDGRRRRI